MFGFAWWKSSTILFQTSSSAGSPHIIMLIVAGSLLPADPLADVGAAPPPQAASIRERITIMLRNKGNRLFIFSLLLNLNGRIADAKVSSCSRPRDPA